MDKQATLGFILIGLILVVWLWLQAPPPSQQRKNGVDSARSRELAMKDSARIQRPQVEENAVPPSSTHPEPLGEYFEHLARGNEKVIVIKTDLFTAEVSTKGGLIKKWELQKYTTWDKHPVQLVDFDRGGDLSILFNSTDGKFINTRNLYFESDLPNWKTIELTEDQTYSFDLVLPIAEGKRIIKRLTFTNGKYSFDAEMRFINLDKVISGFEYQVAWEHGIRYAEQNSVDESSFAMAYEFSGGELVDIDAKRNGEVVKKDFTGASSWVATRSKYFAVALLPEEGKSEGAEIQGVAIPQPNGGLKEDYEIGLKMPLKGRAEETAKVTVFLGPLDYNILKSYHGSLYEIMSLGAAWIIRPISEYVLMPLFQFLHYLIPNFGLVIIVFSIIIKIALHPLTKTSMKSMKKMQALQPMMTEIKEKYKDDPQKMNQSVMNLYKEYGVNPAAGCLPLLLQMPILFALYAVFRSAIGLRQAHFVWWITDLSIPDRVVTLPFTIPFFGITQLSGLALAMGITMFVQQKMTTTDPRQKAMVWMMPIMMTLLFNSFPAGLNLYYFVFNLLSIGQQMWINKQHGNEPLRKVEPKKRSGGFMERLTKDLPKVNR